MTEPTFAPRQFSREELSGSFSTIRWAFRGRVTRVVGTLIEVIMPGTQLGAVVSITAIGRSDKILAEVVGFKEDRVLLLPYGHLNGVAPGCMVTEYAMFSRIATGDFLLGKVVDPFLQPLAGGPLDISGDVHYQEIDREAPNPLERQRITTPLSLGVRAIDGLLTLGQGQRIGIMAGSGVGKSKLMGMMARYSEADINVIALIGERGREVREFIEDDLGEEGLKRSIIVAVTGDHSPLMRVRGAKVATAIAEHFSAQGKNVLLMMDSLTRVAMAQREIGNAIGEPPTTKGYTPSVFSLLPKLLERAGPQAAGMGSISALYTVLVDGDDFNEPIADAARSILDGHIVLTRELANRGHYPAIDITASASRVMHDIVPKEHWHMAMVFKEMMALYQETQMQRQSGIYQRGANPKLDAAVQLMPLFEDFLRQDVDEKASFETAYNHMHHALTGRTFSHASAS